MPQNTNPPPFIADQGMKLLDRVPDPREYLHARLFRAQRPGQDEASIPEDLKARLQKWKPVDRLNVALDSLEKSNGEPDSLQRLVVTTDAGIGKTTTLQWLHHAINQQVLPEI